MSLPAAFASGLWRSAFVPAATAAVGAAAALLDRGVWTAALVATLLALCAWAARTNRRRSAALAEAEQLRGEHRILRECVEHNPLAFAVYDGNDELIAWNKAYQTIHAEAFRQLQPRLNEGRIKYVDLVRVTETVLRGEAAEEEVVRRVALQRRADGVGVDREYPGLGWLRVSKFAMPSGAVAGFAVDINQLKQREAALREQVALSQSLAVQLRELADTDALTGAASRRAFLERADEAFMRSRRYGDDLCLALLDIDAFKAVNDTHGHAAGDEVLAGVVARCKAQLRDGADICGRIGGEEFAILLPQTSAAGGRALAERLRQAIAACVFKVAGRSFHVSASLGVAARTERDNNVAAMLARADAALYRAKDSGRDRVELAENSTRCPGTPLADTAAEPGASAPVS